MKVETIEELIRGIKEGQIVLPDFQRSFVWRPEQVRELLVSVCSNYFIGSMLAMDLTEEECMFQLRLFEGVEKVNPTAGIKRIVKIILDGQQRCTALFYAIFQPDIPLKGANYPYVFYLDIEKALKEEFDEAVIAVNNGNKKMLGEMLDREKRKEIISFKTLWNLDADTLLKYTEIPTRGAERVDTEKLNKLWQISQNFKNFKLHIVDINDKDPEKIVEIFERINRTGEPLSVWDLLTAKLYRHGIKLRELIENAEQNYEFLEDVESREILKVIALLRGEPPKRKNLLNLSHEKFEDHFNKACDLLGKAYRRMKSLDEKRGGYGVLDFKKWTPYTSMIVPLAVTLNDCKDVTDFEKVNKWYWISVFDQRYDKSVDSRIYEDVKKMTEWIRENKMPDFIQNFQPEKINFSNVDKQSNAIYRGVINLIVLKGALDFITGDPPEFEPRKVQDDHIFPKSMYKNSDILKSKYKILNCILNRTLITSNQSKGDKMPSHFFSEKLKKFGRNKLLEIMRTHLISEEAFEYLLKDDLEKFMEARKKTIIEEIKSKTRWENYNNF